MLEDGFVISRSNFLRNEVMNGEKEQHDKGENKTRILVIEDHAIVCQGLTLVINREPDLVVSANAGNADEALEVVEKQQVDLAMVDISLKGANGSQIAEKIKLKCPNLPVLILSMRNEALYSKHALRARAKEYVVNKEATEQIIKALRYVQSLLRSQIFGFTVCVKIEGSVGDDY